MSQYVYVDVYIWRVYCETEGAFVFTNSSSQPTECPNDAGHSILADATARLGIVRNPQADREDIRLHQQGDDAGEFSYEEMNNYDLYQRIKEIQIGTGPPLFPLVMSKNSSGVDLYLEWGGSIDSYEIPWPMPLPMRTISLTFGTQDPASYQLQIYKNQVWATPIYDVTVTPNNTSYIEDLSTGQPNYFELESGDALTFRVTKTDGAALRYPTMVLWLQNYVSGA